MSRVIKELLHTIVPPTAATAIVVPLGLSIAKLASLAAHHFEANDPGSGIMITSEKIEAMTVFFPLLFLAFGVVFAGGPLLSKLIRNALRRAG
ncbi:hypothetical protein YK56LOC_38910 [Caballeronia sp. HLA56]